ncbi:hypothetical protein [Streptomyces sp. NPDC088864]|uniref:hypothetical protein n=1 Tax=Streptomyces sp. NPDC088864 TaxID=3365910 RepID=UPI0037F7605A
MHVFMDDVPGGEPGREDEERLVRTAMERVTDSAPPLPDLVPFALVQGRRRRSRARAAIGAGAVAVVVLGLCGAALPLWGGDGGGKPVYEGTVAAQPTPVDTSVPVRPPVHIEPSPGESSMADLPADELSRQTVFQNEAAGVLEDLLPDAVAPVRPVDLAVSRYQGGPDGPVFPIVFSVRPMGPGAVPSDPPCEDEPDKGLRCREATLPDGITVRAVTTAGDEREGRTVTGVTARFTYGHSRVTLSVRGDDEAMVSAPVTAEQLLDVVRDKQFMELVAYADAKPMEPKENVVRGG